jgi:hypothetical protein
MAASSSALMAKFSTDDECTLFSMDKGARPSGPTPLTWDYYLVAGAGFEPATFGL